MIPLGRIRATPKNGDYMGVPQKNEYFRAKNEPRRPPRGVKGVKVEVYLHTVKSKAR